jgi:ankyrin repeat protein
MTALMCAASIGNESLTKLLLDGNADVNLQDNVSTLIQNSCFKPFKSMSYLITEWKFCLGAVG